VEVTIFRHWVLGGGRQDSRKCLLSSLTCSNEISRLFSLEDGCHCGKIVKLRGKEKEKKNWDSKYM
jgi:hypothetical protein